MYVTCALVISVLYKELYFCYLGQLIVPLLSLAVLLNVQLVELLSLFLCNKDSFIHSMCFTECPSSLSVVDSRYVCSTALCWSGASSALSASTFRTSLPTATCVSVSASSRCSSKSTRKYRTRLANDDGDVWKTHAVSMRTSCAGGRHNMPRPLQVDR